MGLGAWQDNDVLQSKYHPLDRDFQRVNLCRRDRYGQSVAFGHLARLWI
jgi:hypothetical protein